MKSIRHLVLTLVSLIVYLAGCATILSESEPPLFFIDSVPSGARVKHADGRMLGITPLNLKLSSKASANSSEVLYIKQSGFKQAQITIHSEFNSLTLLNFGFMTSSLALPSFTTDQLQQKIYQFKKESYVVELEKKATILVKPTISEEPLQLKPTDIPQSPQTLSIQQSMELDLNKSQPTADVNKPIVEREEHRQKHRQKHRQSQKKTNINSTEPTQRQRKRPLSQEDILLEKMKRRYQEQQRRRQKKRKKRDPRIPKGLEINPLSMWDHSPSHGALAISIARYQILQNEIARGRGGSLENLYLRLSLAIRDDPPSADLVASAYPQFIERVQTHAKVLSAPHGLALFRAIRPLHALSVSSIK